MKVLLTIAICLLSVGSMLGNELIDECLYRFVYHSSIKSAEEDLKPDIDNYVLEVGKKLTKFYPPRHEAYMVLKDSVLKLGITYDELLQLQLERGLLDVRQSMRIFHDYPEKGKTAEVRNIGNDYMAIEDTPIQKWEVMEGDTVVAGYKCRRARTTFRGRNWEVWYTEEIPVHRGPWKLGGLPGLILYAKDSENLFSFDCRKIEKGSGRRIEFVAKPGYRKCSVKELVDLQCDWTTNSLGMMMQLSGLADETFPYKTKKRTPSPLERPE